MLHLSQPFSISPFLFHVVTGTTMYILSARPLMLLHSPSRLKPEEKRGRKRRRRDSVVCFLSLFPSLSLSLARHLTSPGKRQIRFRLLSRQSKLREREKSFFPSFLLSLCLFLSLSLSVFASFPWMRCCEGRLHAFQTITVHPLPTASFLSARTLHMPAHPLESLEPTTNAKHFHRREKKGAHPQAPV